MTKDRLFSENQVVDNSYPARSKSLLNDRMKQLITPYLFSTPGMLLLLAILAYPIAWGFVLSLQKMNLATLDPSEFIGFENYVQLFQDPLFISSLIHTLIFVVVSVFLECVLGLMYALLLHENFIGRNLLRGIVLLPWMIAPVVVAFIWSWMLNDSAGIINYLLLKLGLISSNIQWLSSQQLALPVIILTDVWREAPFVALVLLAGLQGIPDHLYEAAKIDGASAFRRFLHITLPLLKPAVAVALLMRTMIALRLFDMVWVMTRGGPAGATEVLGTYAYKKSLLGFNMGYGSAVTTIILMVSILLSIGYIRVLLKRESDY